MEKTKKTIQMRMAALMLMEAAALIFLVLDRTGLGSRLGEDVKNIHFGFASGLACAGLWFILILARTLRDEKLLKQRAVNEQDERNIAIRAKAGMPMLMVTSVVMLMVGMVAGYWSETVMKTLFAAGIAQLLFGLAAKIYYQKKM